MVCVAAVGNAARLGGRSSGFLLQWIEWKLDRTAQLCSASSGKAHSVDAASASGRFDEAAGSAAEGIFWNMQERTNVRTSIGRHSSSQHYHDQADWQVMANERC